ncbi:MAG: hypothetical protein BIFFINMI_02754 [Phycisphaerae bacterium]|nr:hypothetical protein [Phycisphaerae bacterium]
MRKMLASALLSALLTVLPQTVRAAAPTTQPTSQPDCVWTGVDRIVAVGDVHGDFGQFVAVLRAAGVIDEQDNWIGGRTHLVQTGDVLDRGPDSRKGMDLLMKLEAQAAKTGGMVHPLLGNHEVMVPLGDWRYVNPAEVEAFGGEGPYREAMSPAGHYGRWLRTHNTVIRINDVAFVHAGISLAVSKMPLEKINRAMREQLARGEMEGLGMEADGPVWDRGLAVGEPEVVARKLAIILPRLGARHLVIGHTVDTDGVQCVAGGRLFRIDVGMSRFYGGPAACLVVDRGVYSEVRQGREPRVLLREAPTTQPAEAAP